MGPLLHRVKVSTFSNLQGSGTTGNGGGETMDWNERAREMTDAWLETQRAMWRQWSGDGGDAAPIPGQRQMIEQWREGLDRAFEMQEAWLDRWARAGRDLEGEELRAWTEQGRSAMHAWLTTQRRMWDAWLDAFSRTGSSEDDATASAAGRAWRESLERMAELQERWVDGLSGVADHDPSTEEGR